MVDILPFKRTAALIGEIDEYVDRVSEAVMVLDRTVRHYLDNGPDEQLLERLAQVRQIELRADELRRGVANVMYGEMLMPETRGDVLELLDDVDFAMDGCTHVLVRLAIERPEIPDQFTEGFRAMLGEVIASVEAMLRAARTFFKEPHAIRDHVYKVGFHNNEATALAVTTGKAIFDSELPLERKRQLADMLGEIRELGSEASDIADQLAIHVVKHAL